MTDDKKHKPGLFAKAFNTSVLEKSRMAWVDYLRGIAIILVAYRHSLVGIQRSGAAIPEYLIDLFYNFRMPLFFIVSGIFISRSLAKKSFKELVGIKFENLIYPYIIWCIIQISLQIAFSGYVNSDRSWIDYTYIIYQPKALDQFWYLPALFNATIIYMFLKVKLKATIWVQVFLGIFFYYLAPFLGKISMLSGWMEFYIYFAIGDILSGFFFNERIQRFLKNPWNLLSILPLFAVTQYFYLTQKEVYFHDDPVGQSELLIIACIGCFTMFLLAFRMQVLNLFPFLRVLGYHSLYIYIMHVLVIAFVRVILTKLLGLHNPYILLPCCMFFGVTIPVIVYNLLIKDNIGWFLFSYKKPRTVK